MLSTFKHSFCYKLGVILLIVDIFIPMGGHGCQCVALLRAYYAAETALAVILALDIPQSR